VSRDRAAVLSAALCTAQAADLQHVREAVSYRVLFIAGWFSMRKKHCFRLKIYNRLRASET